MLSYDWLISTVSSINVCETALILVSGLIMSWQILLLHLLTISLCQVHTSPHLIYHLITTTLPGDEHDAKAGEHLRDSDQQAAHHQGETSIVQVVTKLLPQEEFNKAKELMRTCEEDIELVKCEGSCVSSTMPSAMERWVNTYQDDFHSNNLIKMTMITWWLQTISYLILAKVWVH